MRLLASRLCSACGCVDRRRAAQDKKTVTIAVSGPPAQLYFLPVVLAKQLGYFEQAGVNVELQHFNAGSKALESVVGGSADIVAGAYENTVRMQAKGQPMQSIVLFGRYPQNILGIAKAQAGSYKSPADLKGQKIGITGPGSATQTFLNLILATAGLRPGDVTPITVGAGAVAVAAMRRQGELYAISNLDLAITELTMSGDIVVAYRQSQCRRHPSGLWRRLRLGQPLCAGGLRAEESEERRGHCGGNGPHARLDEEGHARRDRDQASGRFLPEQSGGLSEGAGEQPAELLARRADAERRPGNVLKAMVRFDPAIASAKVDMAATYDNRFVESALKAVK